MPKCFQHPKKKAEAVLRFYDQGSLVEFGLCRTCQHATSIAGLQLDGFLGPNYEIVEIDDAS